MQAPKALAATNAGAHGSGGGAGKPCLSDLSITKAVDSASPALLGGMPGESITLSFTSMTLKYAVQKADGSLAPAREATVSNSC